MNGRAFLRNLKYCRDEAASGEEGDAEKRTIKVLDGSSGTLRLLVGQSGVSLRLASFSVGVNVDGWLAKPAVYL